MAKHRHKYTVTKRERPPKASRYWQIEHCECECGRKIKKHFLPTIEGIYSRPLVVSIVT
jgi:hypothetical protein